VTHTLEFDVTVEHKGRSVDKFKELTRSVRSPFSVLSVSLIPLRDGR